MKEKLIHKRLTKPPECYSDLAVSIQVDVPSKGVTYFSNATSDLHSDVRRPCKLRGRNHACKQDVLKNTGIYEVSLPSIHSRGKV